MAANTQNKYPADKAGTKYSEFKNTKRVPPGKTKAEQARQSGGGKGQTADKTS
ncbi:hypothetical protein GCM10027343_38670 [Noviherbaspirillum agri]